jgi:hypothetical protein
MYVMSHPGIHPTLQVVDTQSNNGSVPPSGLQDLSMTASLGDQSTATASSGSGEYQVIKLRCPCPTNFFQALCIPRRYVCVDVCAHALTLRTGGCCTVGFVLFPPLCCTTWQPVGDAHGGRRLGRHCDCPGIQLWGIGEFSPSLYRADRSRRHDLWCAHRDQPGLEQSPCAPAHVYPLKRTRHTKFVHNMYFCCVASSIAGRRSHA